jgi:hypothetical protein
VFDGNKAQLFKDTDIKIQIHNRMHSVKSITIVLVFVNPPILYSISEYRSMKKSQEAGNSKYNTLWSHSFRTVKRVKCYAHVQFPNPHPVPYSDCSTLTCNWRSSHFIPQVSSPDWGMYFD